MPSKAAPPAIRKARKAPGGGRLAPGKRGVGRNHTFKFRSSIFVAQRKSKSIEDYYDLLQELNEGAYGVVYKAINKESGAERAVKKIEKSKWNPEENQKVIDEFNVLKGLDHPNILKMYELFEEDQHFYIVTDICKGGDLLDELEAMEETGCFPEADAAILMNQVLSSVNYCHKNNYVHRDLKPENILLEQNKALHEIKLIDFGFAVPCDETHTMSEQKGTAAYMSPQAMLEEPYGQKTDVWAIGVIAYIVLAGFNPFEGHTDPETAVLVEMGEFELDIPEWDNISADAKDFVSKCLAYEEKDRLTASQALEHPWVRNCRSNINSDFYKSAATECVGAMHNLQKFHAQSKLKQATCTFIASQLISKEEKESIDKLFRSMDTDSDGKLGRQEVQVGYKAIFGEDFPDKDLDSLFKEVDMNQDGIIEYSDFVVAAMNEDLLLSTNNLRKAFDMFDHDKDGNISRADMVEVMKSIGGGKEVEDVIIDKIMNQVDTNKSGQVDFDEFKESMFRTNTEPETADAAQDEEDVLMEEARRRASESDDNVSTTSSKKITAKSALIMPRRRSSAAENLVAVLKDGTVKQPPFARTLSGSSDMSALSGDSADEPPRRTSNTPPPAGIVVSNSRENSPMRRPGGAHKKGITRTKSGFMTQRAEPTGQPRRGGKKPVKPAAKTAEPDAAKKKAAAAPPKKAAAEATKKPEKKEESPKKKKEESPKKKDSSPKQARRQSDASNSSSSSSSSSSSGSSSSSSSSSSSDGSASKASKKEKSPEKEKKKSPEKAKSPETKKSTPPKKVAPAEKAKAPEPEKKAEPAKPKAPAKAAAPEKKASPPAKAAAPEKKASPPAKAAAPEKKTTTPTKAPAAAKPTTSPKPPKKPAAAAPKPKSPVKVAKPKVEKKVDKPPEDTTKEKTPPEEKKSDTSPSGMDDSSKRMDGSSKRMDGSSMRLDNSSHRLDGSSRHSQTGTTTTTEKKNKVGLDRLGDLPSSSNYKKQQKYKKPNSSSASLPAVPTQQSIQERKQTAPDVGKRSSTGAAPSIQDRMKNFKGTGGVIKAFFPTNKGRSGARGVTSPKAKKPTVQRDGRISSSLTSGDSGHDKKTGTNLRSSTGSAMSPKSTKAKVPKMKTTGDTPSGKQSSTMHDHSNGSLADEGSGDLLAGAKQAPVRRNSLGDKDKDAIAANAQKGDGNVRGSLKNRMSIFEQNIQKNQEKGVKKALW